MKTRGVWMAGAGEDGKASSGRHGRMTWAVWRDCRYVGGKRGGVRCGEGSASSRGGAAAEAGKGGRCCLISWL